MEIELILNLHGGRKSLPITKTVLKKKRRENKLILPDIKTYCKAIMFKATVKVCGTIAGTEEYNEYRHRSICQLCPWGVNI